MQDLQHEYEKGYNQGLKEAIRTIKDIRDKARNTHFQKQASNVYMSDSELRGHSDTIKVLDVIITTMEHGGNSRGGRLIL